MVTFALKRDEQMVNNSERDSNIPNFENSRNKSQAQYEEVGG